MADLWLLRRLAAFDQSNPDRLTGFILAWAAAEVAVALTLWIVATRQDPIEWSQVSLRKIPSKHRDAWRFVWSTNMSGSLTIAGKQGMILLVGVFGGESFAGGFRVASPILALVLLETAMNWNGLKGAAFAVLGASSLSVIGFWIAIVSLEQIKITVQPAKDDEKER